MSTFRVARIRVEVDLIDENGSTRSCPVMELEEGKNCASIQLDEVTTLPVNTIRDITGLPIKMERTGEYHREYKIYATGWKHRDQLPPEKRTDHGVRPAMTNA